MPCVKLQPHPLPGPVTPPGAAGDGAEEVCGGRAAAWRGVVCRVQEHCQLEEAHTGDLTAGGQVGGCATVTHTRTRSDTTTPYTVLY